MKKTYKKPEISFESFLMSTNIAGNCEGPAVGNPSRGSCGIPGSAPGMNLFSATIDGPNGCQIPSVDDPNDKFCYHNPTEYNNLFNS